MYQVDVRWLILAVCVGAAGVVVALKPALSEPILVAVAVGTLLYIVLRLGRRSDEEG
jgi:hypothetical protein